MTAEKMFLSSITGSEKSISLSTAVPSEIEETEWKDRFLSNLKEVFKIERLSTGEPLRIVASNEAVMLIAKWIEFLMKKTGSETPTDETLNILLELLRCLRNCTSNLQTQNYINEQTNIINHIASLFELVFKSNKDHLILKVILQFLNNFISSNEKTSSSVYKSFFDHIKTCLKENVNIYETSALIYNISLFIPIEDADTFHSILSIFKNENYDEMDHYEFLHFFLEKSIGTREFWSIYTTLTLNDKITMLDYFKHLQIQKRTLTIHDEGLNTLINTILTSSDIIFQTRDCSDSDQELINEISLTLEILSSLSSDENYLRKLQTDKDLFINAGVLLINVHKLGKEPNSCFTPLQKLSELGKSNDGLKNHPAFGFKADLIRLIGNMCWKSPEMQNLARTADLIPVILDSCNIDARNPFIIQWAILAIRNLLENNTENQKIVAGLHQDGVVPAEVLNQLGLTLHSDGDNELKVVPLDALKKVCNKHFDKHDLILYYLPLICT